MDVIYKKMNDDGELLGEDPTAPSEIREFYKGQTIFITGATGFLGVSFMEKLLRTCTGVEKMYVLVRPKRNVSPVDRMKKYFQDEVFNRIREENPDFEKKVIPVEGDLQKPGLNISAEMRRRVCEEATIVIHNAANVNFLLRLSVALTVNALGTREVLELASECKNMKVFIYVSTGYSQSHQRHIREDAYPPPIDHERVKELIRMDTATEEGLTTEEVEKIIGDFPNRYCFTKAIAEGYVAEYSKKASFPHIIFRPTIVISTYKEPYKGWSNTPNGPIEPVIKIALGMFHATPTISDNLMDVVPVDMTTNFLLTLLWAVTTKIKSKENCHVYNYSNNKLCPITIGELSGIVERDCLILPTLKLIYYPFFFRMKTYTGFYIVHSIVHVLPCFLFDLGRRLTGKPPFAMDIVRKQMKGILLRNRFLNETWTLDTSRGIEVWDLMNNADKREFFSDLRELDWQDYMMTYWPGVRRYILKDPIETLPAAKKKLRKFAIIHYTTSTIFFLFIFFILYAIVSLIFF